MRKRTLATAAIAIVLIAGTIAVVVTRDTSDDPANAIDVKAGQSLSEAVKRSSGGETLLVHEGADTKLKIESRTWDQPITIQGASDGTSPLDDLLIKKSSGLNLRKVKLSGTTSIEFSNRVELTDSHTSTVRVRDDSHNILVANNTIEGAGGLWIHSGNPKPTPPVRNLVIRNNNIFGQDSDNIQIGIANDVLIEDNLLHDADTSKYHNDGVQLMGGERVTIRRNRFWNHDQAILLKAETGLFGDNVVVKDVRVENNLIVHQRGAGIIVARSSGAEIVNNTIYDNKFADLHIDGPNTNLKVWNNVMKQIFVKKGLQPPEFENFNCVQAGGTGSSDVKGDPQFIDTANYALRQTSPCQGLGQDEGAPIDDLGKNKRTGAGNPGIWASGATLDAPKTYEPLKPQNTPEASADDTASDQN